MKTFHYKWLIFLIFSVEKSLQIISIECNTSLLSVLDDSGSNLFVIGDRRNRFLVNDEEYSYFCSVQKSWVKDILDYIRECMPMFSTQKLMTRKLGFQMQLQANKLCNSSQLPTTLLYINTICLNKVINELHNCMEDMIDYMSLVQHRVNGIQKLTHLCCGYLEMRNCTRHILNTRMKRSCHNTTQWFDQLMSGYSLRFFKQFCVTEENCYQNICESLEKLDKSLYEIYGKNRDKSILPAIMKIMLTTDI